jgi:hypothetical protein
LSEAELERFGLPQNLFKSLKSTTPTTTTTELKTTTEKIPETTEHPIDARLAVIDLSENDIEQGKTPFDLAVEKVLNSSILDVQKSGNRECIDS